MPWYVDSREQDAKLKKASNGVRLLGYDESRNLSFDILIDTGGTILRAEKKRIDDLVSSIKEGKLDAQLAAVDLLIIEGSEIDRTKSEYRDFIPHVWRIALSCPVLHTSGPEDTIRLIQYLESHPGLFVFKNRIAAKRGDVIQDILSALPGVNPTRPMPDGRTLGDLLAPHIDRLSLLWSLNIDQWPTIDYQGTRKLGKGTLSNITDAILGDSHAPANPTLSPHAPE